MLAKSFVTELFARHNWQESPDNGKILPFMRRSTGGREWLLFLKSHVMRLICEKITSKSIHTCSNLNEAMQFATICEMRYAGEDEYGFTQESKARLHRRGRLFREATSVKKAIAYALVTTVALKRNEYSDAVQSEVSLGDLFRKECERDEEECWSD